MRLTSAKPPSAHGGSSKQGIYRNVGRFCNFSGRNISWKIEREEALYFDRDVASTRKIEGLTL